MGDRRRTPRHVLSTPVPADVMALQDATVERVDDDRVTVIAPARHDVDDELIVHLPTGKGVVSHRARVLTSEPVSVAGVVHFRLELALEPPSPQDRAA